MATRKKPIQTLNAARLRFFKKQFDTVDELLEQLNAFIPFVDQQLSQLHMELVRVRVTLRSLIWRAQEKRDAERTK